MAAPAEHTEGIPARLPAPAGKHGSKEEMTIYLWLKALHIISVIIWMAGMLYLPQLFVYHADAKPRSALSETLKLMELRLLRHIVNPAMIATFIFGIWMLILNSSLLREPFMYVKLGAVLLITAIHGYFSRWRRLFAKDRNPHAASFFHVLNGLQAILVIVIVVMIAVRPHFPVADLFQKTS